METDINKVLKVKSFVGGHDILVFTGCSFDPALRKYTGGRLIATIPYCGRMLSAKTAQEDGEMNINGTVVPVKSKQVFVYADPVPPADECDYCIVSAMYVAACRSLGMDTSRLLTIGDTVADDEGRVIGCINFNRN